MSKISPKTLRLVYCATFIAIAVILSVFSIYLGENIKIALAPIVVMFAGIILGPVSGAIVGASSDLLVLLVKSLPGTYFPGFTITMAIYGLLAGLLFYKKNDSAPKLILGTIFIQTICSILINTFWLYFLYGTPYFVLLVSRFPSTYIACAVYIVVLLVLVRNKEKMFKTLYHA
ncbi:folate ECF transporter [Christensenellaceae bacterium]|nr:folate ECF transporter [Christensenellaceae bacterium]BDF60361.1 folate ECF transporter [Christensenellaceae bacterium]